jgi:hypothetical protein
MPDPSASDTSSVRELLLRWTRAHTWGAIVAVLALVLMAIVQIAAFSAWRMGLADRNIPVAPVNAAVVVDEKNRDALVFSFVGIPAVSATKSINVNTDRVLGVSLSFDRIPEQTKLTLGWVGTRDRRKPSNLAVPLAASKEATSVYVPLRGHSEWRDSITQFAVMLASRPGSEAVTLSRIEFVDATPSSALSHASKRWFASPSFTKPPGSAERVIPLSALLAIAAAIAFGAIAWRRRNDALAWRDASFGALAAFALVALLLSAFRPEAFSLNAASVPWLLSAAAISFALFGQRFAKRARFELPSIAEIASILCAIGSLWFGHWPFAWVAITVVVALLAHRFLATFPYAKASLFFAPLLALGGFAQAIAAKQIVVADTALRDPSSLLANLIEQSGAVASTAIVLLLALLFSHASRRGKRDSVAAIALWFATLGTIACLIVLPADRILEISTGAIWILLPIVVAVFAWVMPSFLAPVGATTIAAVANNKTEHDLSDVVRQLFDGAAESFTQAIRGERPASAFAPLNRMKEIAPASFITRAAELNFALLGTNLVSVHDAYLALKTAPESALDDAQKSLVLAYANRTNDFDEVVARTRALPPTEHSLRLFARASVLRASESELEAARLAAIEALSSCPTPNNLAHEIAELHLLARDWEAARNALAGSSIALDSPAGQVYVSRLGFVATNGQRSYVEQIQRHATWNSTLAVAQVAMGELLLAEGNLPGARARFKLAKDGDITLWVAERRIKDIDAQLAKQSGNDVANHTAKVAVA